MAQSAFLIGGTGQIGRAVALRLAEAGWEVTVAGRSREHMPKALGQVGVRFAALDRHESNELATALGDGADLLVDVVAYAEADAQQLLGLRDRYGSIVAISSASVYADAEGRTLDEARGAGDFPILPVPVPERQPTVSPGEGTYSTRKVAMERTLLAGGVRATVLRPCAIHGPGATAAREWHFVKRALDGRRVVVFAHRGESRFHTTSVANLAELVRLAARRPGDRVLNCGDPQPPTVLRIGRAVATVLEHDWAEVLLPGAAPAEALDNPWAVPHPFLLDMTEAEIQLGYRPVTTYERAVGETCRWLVDVTHGRDWREVLPGAARHMAHGFDYDAEDEHLRSLAS